MAWMTKEKAEEFCVENKLMNSNVIELNHPEFERLLSRLRLSERKTCKFEII